MRLTYLLLALGLTGSLIVACSEEEQSDDDDDGTGGTTATGQGGTGTGTGAAGEGGTAPCSNVLTDPDNCGECGHGCLGGACLAGLCQPVALRGDFWGSTPWDIDDTSLFYVTSTGELMHGPKEPMAADQSLASLGYQPAELLSRGETLYYCTDNGCYGDAGSQVAALAKSGGSPTLLGTSVDSFDADDAAIYYLFENGDGPVHSVPVTGGSPTELSAATSSWGAYGKRGIYADGSFLYVPAYGYSGQGPALFRVPKNGSAGGIMAEPDTSPAYLAFNSDLIVGGANSPAFFQSSDCSASPSMTIWTLPKSGGTATTVATRSAFVRTLAADDEHVYWAEFCEDGLWRAPLTGGDPPQMLWAGTDQYVRSKIALDASAIYFVDEDTDQLMRLAK